MITKIKKNQNPSLLFFSLLTIFLLAFLVFSNFKLRERIERLNLFFQSLNQEIQSLEEENKRLRREIDLAKGESYWEEKIREQGYRKPGEEIVVVLPPEKKLKTEKENREKGNKENNWQALIKERFWEIIGRFKI